MTEEKKPRYSTVISFDRELYIKAKHYAIDHNLTIRELIEKALRKEMGIDIENE